MFYKNTQALPKQQKPVNGTEADIAALWAIAGSCCSVCDMPLPRTDVLLRGSYRKPHSAFTCCNHAYCPYCGADAKENCPHLVAEQVGGNWRVFGLPDIGIALPPSPPPITPSSLFDHTRAQKRAAWGEAYPLLNTMNQADWNEKPFGKINAERLVEWIARPEARLDVVQNRSVRSYYFSPSSDKIAERLRKALVDDLPEAFTRLKAQSVSNLQYLTHAAEFVPFSEAAGGGESDRVCFVAYSPNGKYLVAMSRLQGEVWEVAGGSPVVAATFALSPDPGRPRLFYHAIRFAETGDHFDIWWVGDAHYVSRHPAVVEAHSLLDAALLQRRSYPPGFVYAENELPPSSTSLTELPLHGGKSIVSWRSGRLSIRRALTGGDRAGTALVIPLRQMVRHVAVSPDGETLALATPRFVCLCRVPYAAVVAADRKRAGSGSDQPVS